MITPAEWRQWRIDAERDPLTVRLISVEETLALLDELERCERQIDDHYDAARDRLRERDEALDRLRLMTREATYVAAGDLDALRMDLDEACPHGTEGHGGHAEGTCEVCDYAFATNAIVDEWYEKVRSDTQEAGA